MTTSPARGAAVDHVLHHEVEAFLYREAELLDAWRLDEWLALTTQDFVYEIPSTDAESGDLSKELGFVRDNRERIEARVTRLKSRHAHREFPWSRTRRLVTNIRARHGEGEGLEIEANFAVWRFRSAAADAFVGRYEYRLERDAGELAIASKRAWLDLESLHPHGTVSIIL